MINILKKMTKISYVMILLFIFSNTLAEKITDADAIATKIAAKSNNLLKPTVIKMALNAFYHAKELGVKIQKPILTIVDYTLPSTQKRLWVIDVEKKEILYTSMVAHGKHSGENYTTSFSNMHGSKQSSIGVFLTEDTYFGKNGYSLRLNGLEKDFNDNAKNRSIVMHAAPYVNEKFASAVGRIGRSAGCLSIEKQLTEKIINTIKDGSLIFSFYNHPQWLSKSKFITNPKPIFQDHYNIYNT
jgi:hypothetical protein